MQKDDLIFRQLFEKESSTYTYLLADKTTAEGILIDPVLETVERDLLLIEQLGIKIKYILETHVHADHITGSSTIKAKTPDAKIALGKNTKVKGNDLFLEDGQTLNFGQKTIKAILTPGHTNGCTSYLCENMVFTGDTLLIRGNGRTDFQEGSPSALYDSITNKLFTLPLETLVYPAHNYNGQMVSTIEEEIKFNPRVGNNRNIEEFTQIMNNLGLPHPKKIDEAVPANLKCGKEL